MAPLLIDLVFAEHHAAADGVLQPRVDDVAGDDQPAKILEVETREKPKYISDPRNLAFLSMISPPTNVKVVGSRGTSVAHTLAMALDDPSMDEDLHETLAAHEIVLKDDWADLE